MDNCSWDSNEIKTGKFKKKEEKNLSVLSSSDFEQKDTLRFVQFLSAFKTKGKLNETKKQNHGDVPVD